MHHVLMYIYIISFQWTDAGKDHHWDAKEATQILKILNVCLYVCKNSTLCCLIFLFETRRKQPEQGFYFILIR